MSSQRNEEDIERVASPPTGTVTFLFTDIQGSTRLWERDAKKMQNALARHDEILKDVVVAHDGYVFKMVGDACCAAFSSAPKALEAALRGLPRSTGGSPKSLAPLFPIGATRGRP